MFKHLKKIPHYFRKAPEKLKLAYRCVRSPYFRWVGPGHFYSPFPDMEELARRESYIYLPVTEELPGLDLRPCEQQQLLAKLEPFYGQLPFERSHNPNSRFVRPNGSFPFQDAFMLYAMIRHLKPQKLVEVGCGNSSCVILDTCEALSLQTALTFIEPYPAFLRERIRPGDEQRFTLLAQCVQDVPLEVFTQLEADDVLFIDTSHVSKMGSDVNHIVFKILPSLKPGVYIHFHDIWYPFEYPKDWLQMGMFWNEAYLLRAFLMFNPAFEIVMFNNYVVRCHSQSVRSAFPMFLEEPGASLWLRRC